MAGAGGGREENIEHLSLGSKFQLRSSKLGVKKKERKRKKNEKNMEKTVGGWRGGGGERTSNGYDLLRPVLLRPSPTWVQSYLGPVLLRADQLRPGQRRPGQRRPGLVLWCVVVCCVCVCLCVLCVCLGCVSCVRINT